MAAVFTAGCAIEPEDGDEPATEEVISWLSGTAPVSWVGVDFHTGGDDKRNDSRVWIRVSLSNANDVVREVLPGITWPDWTSTGVQLIQLPIGTKNQDIQSVSIEWQQGGGGFNGDNWNLQSLAIYAWDPSYGYNLRGAPGGNPLRRFTGSITQYVWHWAP
jgi:hypothetical protein